MSNSANIPVVLIHGWAGSYRETWEKPGINALLEDVGRTVIGLDLIQPRMNISTLGSCNSYLLTNPSMLSPFLLVL
jgi:hypothetical protein